MLTTGFLVVAYKPDLDEALGPIVAHLTAFAGGIFLPLVGVGMLALGIAMRQKGK
jgi:uncharacterized membrane protein YidH (DUF202 family)